MKGKRGRPTKEAANAELARLFGEEAGLERLPGYQRPEVLLEHGLAVIVRVTQGEDQKLAFEAGKWLVEYSAALAASKKPGDREVVIRELRRLYAKVLPQGEIVDSEIVEAVPEEVENGGSR